MENCNLDGIPAKPANIFCRGAFEVHPRRKGLGKFQRELIRILCCLPAAAIDPNGTIEEPILDEGRRDDPVAVCVGGIDRECRIPFGDSFRFFSRPVQHRSQRRSQNHIGARPQQATSEEHGDVIVPFELHPDTLEGFEKDRIARIAAHQFLVQRCRAFIIPSTFQRLCQTKLRLPVLRLRGSRVRQEGEKPHDQ